MTGTIRLARSSSSPATSFPSTDNGGQWCCRSQLNHPLRKLAQQLASSHQASSCEMSINLRPWRLRPLFNDFLYPLCIIHQLSEVVDNLEVYHRWALHHKSKRGARTATVFYGTLEETINVGRIISNIWTTRSSMSFVCIDHPLWFACWMVRIPSWVKELGCSLMAKDFVWYIKKKHWFCLFQSLLFYLLLNLFGKNVMCRWQEINKHLGFLKSAMVRITLNTPLPFDGESLAAVLEQKGTTWKCMALCSPKNRTWDNILWRQQSQHTLMSCFKQHKH